MKVEINETKIKVVEEPKEVELSKTYVIRGIADKGNFKEVVKEKEFSCYPSNKDIAQLLNNNKDVTFCVVEEKYKLVK